MNARVCSKLSKNDSRTELTSPYLVERVDLRFYNDMIKEISDYQMNNYIPTRPGAIIELIRLGLINQHDNSEDDIGNAYGNNKDFKRIEVNYPLPLLELINEYGDRKNITRSSAIKDLIRIGLRNPLPPLSP